MQFHWLFFLSILSAVILSNIAVPPALLWGDIRVKHTWNTVPANWESLGPPPAGTTIDLHIALTPHHENALIDALYEVSDPGHQRYGAHLTKEQVTELVAPHQDTLGIVRSWLEHHSVLLSSISMSHGGGWLTISGVPVSQADKLLCASYQLYRHIGTNGTEVILRTVGYSLPAALHAHVQTVVPTTHFASQRTPLQTPHTRSGEGAAAMANETSEVLARARTRPKYVVVPSYLRYLYKTETYVPSATDRNALGIMGSWNGFPSQADLKRFLTAFRTDAVAATFTVVETGGTAYESDTSLPRADESVFMQYATAIAYPTPQIFYNTGGFLLWENNDGGPAPGDAYLGWFDHILDAPNIPQTISITNTNIESLIPLEYARVVCDLFARLGVLGVTVLVPSGDDGVGRGDCIDSSGNVRFIPMFPASCPWVTSVGGTVSRNPEIAASLSGGGFSDYFPRPKYQRIAVPAFLRILGFGHAGLYQREGRGIPDVASQAKDFAYVLGKVIEVANSTSCSTPTVAGIVSLLNDYLLTNNMAPLGFLNPLLYRYHLNIVKDVIHGSNPGCNTNGFVATTGWDPVTGVGTLNFQRLLNFLPRVAQHQPSGTSLESPQPSQ